MFMAALTMMTASTVAQASQCSSGAECPSDDKLQNVVSLLHTKLQMSVLKRDGEAATPGPTQAEVEVEKETMAEALAVKSAEAEFIKEGEESQVAYKDTKESEEKALLKDPANLESTVAASQICQALDFAKTCQPFPGKLVLLVTVNRDMIDFFSQWHASASEFQNKSCMHLRVMAEDEEAKTSLIQLSKQKGWDLDIDHTPPPSLFQVRKAPFQSDEYLKIVDRRPVYIQELLKKGCTTFYVDIDTIWKKSPFVEIVAIDKGRRDLYSVSDVDVIPPQAATFCTAFMYVNPTTTSLNIIGNWTQSLQFKAILNQPAFNEVLSRGNFTVTQLPYKKFPPGSSYSRFKKEACIAHANCMIGHEAKRRFLKAVADE